MTALEILTPSYRPDLGLFVELHRSVLEFTDASVVHHVVVPRRDVALFESVAAELSSARLRVTAEESVLPRRFVRIDGPTRALSAIPGLTALRKVKMVDARSPWPPVRNWILQQIVKLAVAERSSATVVLVVDSDVCLVRPLTADDLHANGVTRFYARPHGVGPGMADHRAWHDDSRRLLGLEPVTTSTLPDYIAGFVTWDPVLVRATLDRVSAVSGRHWVDTIAGSLRFSEYTLYGTFVDHLADPAARDFARPTTLCAGHWDARPLDQVSAADLLGAVRPEDHAVLIQSTSDTPVGLRREVVQAARRKVMGASDGR
ncbi:hypothetical protein HQ602_09380 [Rhodococcus kroppenstedtii]|uniref:DUF6492 family protein n=1 Tax=Rhodococcoides kroppenstedtii TaxID=293050 RepID=UPI001C9B7354|nr:DUF6492 family protein [Rhodococcus kroppenstedtii]MBY6436594.1 hypothetical protein [Rhodococcus kroppenstedtii]